MHVDPGCVLPACAEDGKDVEVSTGVVECNLQRSLLYCSQHPIEQDLFNPEHARPLFAAGLMHGWTLAVGKRYEREPWGREMLARERERWGARQAAAGAGAKVAAAAAAPARRKKLKVRRRCVETVNVHGRSSKSG